MFFCVVNWSYNCTSAGNRCSGHSKLILGVNAGVNGPWSRNYSESSMSTGSAPNALKLNPTCDGCSKALYCAVLFFAKRCLFCECETGSLFESLAITTGQGTKVQNRRFIPTGS